LGRYDEARAALDKAFKIANHPDASYKPMLTYVYLANAQMLLSETRFSEAMKLSQKAIELVGNQNKDVTIQAKCVLGLADALTGASREGKEICEDAVKAARKATNPRLLSISLLSLAEIMLTTNDPKDALANALEAQASFEGQGQQDSLWRALLIAARACRGGASGSAVEYANRAMDSLSAFQQTLGPEASAIYSKRPDVSARRKQIEQLRATSK
jgi:ATP/maltotriose-dependent transcriptional regulator MalT